LGSAHLKIQRFGRKECIQQLGALPEVRRGMKTGVMTAGLAIGGYLSRKDPFERGGLPLDNPRNIGMMEKWNFGGLNADIGLIFK